MKDSTLKTTLKTTTIVLLFFLFGIFGYFYQQYQSSKTLKNRLKTENQILETSLKNSRIELEIAIKKNIYFKNELVSEKQKMVGYFERNKK
jgi:hypothetical protein